MSIYSRKNQLKSVTRVLQGSESGMSQGKSLRAFLNSRVTINANARISRNKALLILMITAIVLISAGLWLGSRVFGPQNLSYYDYRIQELKEIVREHPEDRVAVMELAMTLYLKGNTRQGISLARKVLNKYPEDPNVLFNLGIMLNDRGDFHESIELLERLFKIHPGFETEKVSFYLGKGYFKTGDYRRALDNLERSVKLDRGNPVAYYYLGRVNEELGKIHNAIEAYKQAILLAGNYPEAEFALRKLQP